MAPDIFYVFGASPSWSGAANFFVARSYDAQTWTNNVMDSASQTAFASRASLQYTQCVVDVSGNVYQIGGADTYKSVNSGVTWSLVSSVNHFPTRVAFSATIYYSTYYQKDIITVAGGTGGNPDRNDVWLSSDGAVNWYCTTLYAPWNPRQDLTMISSASGILVVSAGNVGSQYDTDVWVSMDGGYSWASMGSSLATGYTRVGNPGMTFDASGFLWLMGGNNYTGASASNQVWQSSLSFNNIGQWGQYYGIQVPGNIAAGVQCIGLTSWPGQSPVCDRGIFDLQAYGGTGFGQYAPWSARNTLYGFTTTQSLTYYTSTTTTATAPIGSFVIVGGTGNNDVWISTNNLQSWTPIAGYPNGAAPTTFPTAYATTFTAATGQARCKDPSSNRIYVLGTGNSNVWTSTDFQTWTQPGGSGFSGRQWFRCAVDSTGAVYSLGGLGSGTQVSSDQGATWTTIGTPFINRAANQGGAYYSTAYSTTIMYVMGGVTSGYDWNDVWATKDGARTWIQITAYAPWAARQDFDLAITTTGVVTINGGTANGGAYYADLWTSFNGGYDWFQLNPSPSIGVITLATLLVDSSNYLYLMGGNAIGAPTQMAWVYKSTMSLDQLATTGYTINQAAPYRWRISSNSIPRDINGNLCYGIQYWGTTDTPRCNYAAGIINSRLSSTNLANPYTFDMLQITRQSLGGPNGQILLNGTTPPFSQRRGPHIYSTKQSHSYTYYQSASGQWLNFNVPANRLIFFGGDEYNALQPNGAQVTDVWIANANINANTGGMSWNVIAGQAADPEGQLPGYAQTAGFSEFSGQASCAHPTQDLFYLIGNQQVFRSQDGQNWTQVNISTTAVFPSRLWFACTVDPSGNIYVACGHVGSAYGSDTWVSADQGVTWTQQSTGVFSGRAAQMMASYYSPLLKKEIIWLAAGAGPSACTNDVWASSDGAITWLLLTAAAAWYPRTDTSLLVTSDGVLVFTNGVGTNPAIEFKSACPAFS